MHVLLLLAEKLGRYGVQSVGAELVVALDDLQHVEENAPVRGWRERQGKQ